MSTAVDNVLNNVITATDEATPTMQKVGAEAERMNGRIAASGAAAQRSFNNTNRALQDIGKTGLASKVPGDWTTLHKRVDELLAISTALPTALVGGQKAAEALQAQILGIFNFAQLDKVGNQVGILQTKAELLGRLGGRGMKMFGDQIRQAKTFEQLTQIETAMTAAGQAAAVSGSQFKGFANALESLSGKAFGGVGGTFLGFTVASIGAMFATQAVTQGIENIKEMAKWLGELAKSTRETAVESRQLGLSMEFLETLEVASKKLGIDVGTLRYGMSMLNMALIETPEKFEKLGIKVRDANKNMLPLDQVLKNLADRMATLHTTEAKMGLAAELLGRRVGTQFVPYLEMGAKGIMALTAEGRRMGTVLDEVSEKRLIKLATQLAVVRLQWEGVMTQTGVKLLQLFEPVLDSIFKAMGALRGIVVLLHHIDEIVPQIVQHFASMGAGAALPFPLNLMAGPVTSWLVGSNKPHAPLPPIPSMENMKPGSDAEFMKLLRELMGGGDDAAKALTRALDDLRESLTRLGDTAAASVRDNMEGLVAQFNQMIRFGIPLAEAMKVVRVHMLAIPGGQSLTNLKLFNELLKQTKSLTDKMLADRDKFEAQGGMEAGQPFPMLDLGTGNMQGENNPIIQGMKRMEEQSKRPFADLENTLQKNLTAVGVLTNSFEDMFSTAGGLMDSFWNQFFQRMIQTKTAWGMMWAMMGTIAMKELTRILMSRLWLFLLKIVGNIFAPPTIITDAPLGTPIGPNLGNARPAGGFGSVTNVYVQTFNPRSVLMDIQSGSLGKALTQAAYLREY